MVCYAKGWMVFNNAAACAKARMSDDELMKWRVPKVCEMQQL